MTRSLTIFISALFILLATPVTKKEQLLTLSKKYFPENYVVLKEYDEETINELAHGNSLDEFITDVPTIVHEAYHHYQGFHSSYYDASVLFRVNDELTFTVKNFKTFPSREINNIVPAATRKRIFRYDTYVNTKDKYLVTQQYGILGLLEELIAYYHSFSTEISLFNYYKDRYGWKNPDAWCSYLGNMGSYRYSILEFELFISWYLQYAKSKHPETYRDIIHNPGLKKLFGFIDDEQDRLTSLYDEQRATILKQFKGQLQVKDNFIFNLKTHTGKGLYDKEVLEMSSLLEKPEHLLLDLLRK
jgi:hypothetical protein